MTAPLPLPEETLAERCVRLSRQVAAYECDILGKAPLDLSDIRKALADAAAQLQELLAEKNA